VIKCTMLFQLATGTEAPFPSLRRIGGWSESFYFDTDTMSEAIANVNGPVRGTRQPLCPARARLLPGSAQIIGQRFQVVNPVGASQSLNTIWNGSSGLACDIPQMALLTRIPAAATRNVRPYMIRGIPDSLVVDGEFRPTQDFSKALQDLFFTLGFFSMRTRVRPADPVAVASVSAAGVVTFNAIRPALSEGDSLQLLNVVTLGNVLVSGIFTIEKVGPESLTMTIRGWTAGNGIGGLGSGTGLSYPVMQGANATVGRIIVRKVGRPFVGYRGRASVRKKRRLAV
jgi:hypothetical protein